MEINQGIHMIPGVSMSRIYLIEDDELTLVDAGFPWSPRRVLKYIESIGRRPEELRHVLMTHNHPDHTSGALNISKRTGAEIIAHTHDTKTHPDNSRSPGYMGVFNALNLPVPFLRRTPVHHVVEDDHVLPILGGVRVIHTPGHTPGSVCYFVENRGVIFTGDTAFSDGKQVSRSIPFPGYNRHDYKKSLEKLSSMEFDTLCGGHGLPLVGGASNRLAELLEARPELPTWGDLLFKRIPRRLFPARSMSGEGY